MRVQQTKFVYPGRRCSRRMRGTSQATRASHPNVPSSISAEVISYFGLNSLLNHPDWTLPHYAGGSILNLASSLSRHFGVTTKHPVLRSPPQLEGAETVVLLIVDGLGQWQLEKHVAEGDAPNLKALLEHAQHRTITSVFPSTTMAAMTSIHTATSPAESGWLGYTLWLEEVGAVTEMIAQINLETKKQLEDRGFLRAVSGAYSALERAGVNVFAVQPQAYRGSWLNEWYWQGAAQLGYATANTVGSVALPTLETSGRKLVVLYWADYDTVCHKHGPSSTAASDEISAVDHALGRLLSKLPTDGKTAFLLTADHGQVDLAADKAVYLERDSWLVDRLVGAPAGDRLCRTFRVLPHQLEAVRVYLERYGDVIPSADAWEAGLFGGAPAFETFRGRVGDLIVLPRDGSQLCWTFTGKQPSRPHLGSHGGLSHAEMRVPLLSLRV
jgi:predicted AlkP superfamily pyrophosphatase or phosphodiesterase